MSQQAGRRYLSLDGFRDVVRSVKDPGQIDTSQLAVVMSVPTEVKAIGGRDSRLVEFVITTDAVDREQDTLAADGWDTDDYQKNPVVLWCHDHYIPVIGNARSLTRSGNAWKSIAEFTPEDLNPFGYMVYRMYAEGFMHACSVGFQPKEYTYAADRKYGINYIKQSLLEYSCVPVPANPEALVTARSKGINTTPLKDWAERVLDESRTTAHLSDDARHRVEILRAASSPNGRALILELGDMKMAGAPTEKKDAAPPAPTSTIKRVERWECGTDGHVHASESEAKSCSEFDVHVTDVTKSLQGLQSLVKSGSKIRPEAGALMRSIINELAPAEKKEAEKKAEEETTEVDAFELDEAGLRAAVSEAVTERFNQMTGRAD